MKDLNMQYRRFGRTNIQASVFTCGGMRFQHSWKKSDTPPNESIKRVESVVKRNLELGINLIDTANGYGTSEEELGYVLSNVPRDLFHIQTKVPLSEDVSIFRKLFDESMELLRLDYVDLFALHGINNNELLNLALKKGGCLDEALRFKKEGRVKHIGFSTHGSTDIIIDTIRSGGFDYVNLHWFFIFQDNRPAIVEAARQDMGVLIISPNDKGGMLYNPSDKLKRLTEPLSPMVFNNLFCLAAPEIQTLTIGAYLPEDLEEHVNSLQYFGRHDESIPSIVEKLTKEYENVLGKDWTSTWKEGLPQWYETPGNINIPVILFLWNLVKAYDMIEYGKMRFNLMGNGGHWFPGNRPGNLTSYDFTECLQKSPNASIIPKVLNEAYELLADKEVKRLGSH